MIELQVSFYRVRVWKIPARIELVSDRRNSQVFGDVSHTVFLNQDEHFDLHLFMLSA